jgi:TRAP-type C4-dicarboxylate transport system substrate-binding protein
MYQPLLMNKSTFEGLTGAQKKALLDGAKKAEAYYLDEAKKQDANSVKVYKEAGVQIKEMTASEFQAWQNLAKETSYKKFVADYPEGQRFLDLALAVD